jgi:putative ABC transport system substrate-binding protein
MGYVEGRNLAIEYRWANYQQERLAELTRELVDRRVTAIVTMGGPPTAAAKPVTTSVPIIFMTGFDPVTSGYVESLNRPGGNVTGVFILNAQMLYKRLEVLHELVPAAKSIAFFYTRTGDKTELPFYESLQRQAEDSLGVNLHLINVTQPAELEGAFASAEADNAGAILVNNHQVYTSNAKLVVELAARHKLPAMYPTRAFAAAGGLMSYGPDFREAGRQLGDVVGRVLKGEKPETLPVQQVTKVEFVLNAKTAKSLDLEIPLPLLGLAEVIE